MSCLRKSLYYCLRDSWSKLISSLKSSTGTAPISYAKLSGVISSNSGKRLAPFLLLSFALSILLLSSPTSPTEAQEQPPQSRTASETLSSHKVVALVRTERVWKPRKWHLTEKRFFYQVEGKPEPVMLLKRLKGVPSKVKIEIDWHKWINTSCTLFVTGLQVYQSTRAGN